MTLANLMDKIFRTFIWILNSINYLVHHIKIMEVIWICKIKINLTMDSKVKQ